MPVIGDDPIVINQKHSRHLKPVTNQLSDAVSMDNRGLEAGPPDRTAEELVPTAAWQLVSPVERTIRIADAMNVAQAIRGKEVG